jgi:hypothetical protein
MTDDAPLDMRADFRVNRGRWSAAQREAQRWDTTLSRLLRDRVDELAESDRVARAEFQPPS